MNFQETEKKTSELLSRLQAAANKLQTCFGKQLNMDNYSAATYEFKQVKKEYQSMAAKCPPGDQNVFQLGQILRGFDSIINSHSNPYNCV
jgi:hypothetical protein